MWVYARGENLGMRLLDIELETPSSSSPPPPPSLQLFTSLPPLALGLLDQDVSAGTRQALPHLYKASQQHTAFNTKVSGPRQSRECMYMYIECRGFESHPRQLIFLRKSDYLGCVVLLCLVVCLTLLASFFLPH